MSLLSTNITTVKKLSLSQVGLQTIQVEPQPTVSSKTQRAPTPKETTYSKLLAVNPTLGELVESLNLVVMETEEAVKSPAQPERLIAIAKRIIEPEVSYTKEDIIERLQVETRVSQERAEAGFSLLLQVEAIEPTFTGLYYLTGSTPF